MCKKSADMGMYPGMNPATFDAQGGVRRWRAQGIAPDQITASCAGRRI
jgi:hypothetical protein